LKVVGGGNDERYSRDDRGWLRRIYSSRSRTLGLPLANYNPLPGPPKIRSLNPALKMVE
jgi:hypothetical protein